MVSAESETRAERLCYRLGIVFHDSWKLPPLCAGLPTPHSPPDFASDYTAPQTANL